MGRCILGNEKKFMPYLILCQNICYACSFCGKKIFSLQFRAVFSKISLVIKSVVKSLTFVLGSVKNKL